MSTALALPNATTVHAKRLHANISKFRTFVPAHINATQLFAALTIEIDGLPENCTKGSVMVAVVNTCVLGLIPGAALGHCHLVPFTFNRGGDNEYTVAQLIVGYKGFLELAYSNDFLIQCNPEVVLRDETVRRWHDTDGPQIEHQLPDHRQEPTRENVVAAYCTWKTRLGGRGNFWRSRAEIDKIDRGIKSKTPWSSDYRGMCLKSAIRPAAKLWRLTKGMADAVMLDEQAERGENQVPLIPMDDDSDGQTKEEKVRANLLATLNHLCECKTEDECNAVLSEVLHEPVTLSTTTPTMEKAALDALMKWEGEHGVPLSKLGAGAKGRAKR